MRHAIQIFTAGLFACLLSGANVTLAQDAAPGFDEKLPSPYVLSAAYPNPSSSATQFSLTVAEDQQVVVSVFNMLGQQVRTLYEGPIVADEKRTFVFDASTLPSGLYLYRVQGDAFEATRQLTIIK